MKSALGLARKALVATAPHQLAHHVVRSSAIGISTNRYSVPFQLIGRVVEVVRRGEELHIRHGGEVVARHRVLSGSHEVRIDPAHGPGAVARTARQRRSTPPPAEVTAAHAAPIVEVRDLAIYDAVATGVTPTEAQP